MNENVINIIKNRYFHMSKSQKRISDYILNNSTKVAFMTAKALAKESEVSESTVVRFANSIGFIGYPELIDALQDNIKSKITTIERFDLSNDDDFQDEEFNKSIMHYDIKNIKSAIKKNSNETIDLIADELSESNRIYILGLRSSKILSSYLSYYLSLMFSESFVKEIEAQNIFDDLVNLRQGDVLVAIAFPRYSKLTIEALKYAKDNKIIVIGLTDSYMSPICEYSKYTLFADLSISTFINSLVAPMSLINSIIMAISKKNKKTIQQKFEKLENVWDEYGIFR